MNWHKLNNAIHRDLGYLCFGLTIVYVLSGVAVNHSDHWNPSYKVEHRRVNLGGPVTETQLDQQFVRGVLARLGEEGCYLNSFRPDAQTMQIFVEGNTLTINLATGEVWQEKVIPRPLLRQVNFLHLNHPKKLWSWFADLYAICLGILALTGLFVLRGSHGLGGRGAWLSIIGIVIPIFFIWLYY